MMREKWMGKRRRHVITLVCLLVGMLVLTSAVYANYDSASGYTNYKNAIKHLFLKAENFTAEGTMTLEMDGEVLSSMEGNMKYDGKQQSSQMKEGSGNQSFESWMFADGSKTYYYTPDNNSYYVNESSGSKTSNTILGMDDATSKKAVRFMELMADTLIGDLKNNVVLVSEKDGMKEYSVNISKSQIPEVVTAGLSFMFTAQQNRGGSQDASFVNYEDYYTAMDAYCQENYGMTYDEAYEEQDQDEINDMDEAFYKQYSDVLDAKGNKGVVWVRADGSYDYFRTYEEYQKVSGEIGGDMMAMFGTDPYIDDVTFNATIDENGHLAANYLKASLVGTDKSGQRHAATITMDVKVSDYGTTVAETFDPEGKRERR